MGGRKKVRVGRRVEGWSRNEERKGKEKKEKGGGMAKGGRTKGKGE